jgi:hypothetical protein
LINFKRKILEKNILNDFSEFDDFIMLKFLRARKFVLQNAIEMFKNYINWRKSMNVDSLIDYRFDCLKELKKVYPHGYHKTDKLVRIK